MLLYRKRDSEGAYCFPERSSSISGTDLVGKKPLTEMATVFDNTLLQASAFNSIRTFEEQDKNVDMEKLKAIAAIFVQHGMHSQFGAGLLHRHDKLDEGNLMVH